MRKLSGNSVAQRTAALRFLFVKTLKRPDMLEHIPFPKVLLRLPTVLSPEEVTHLIEAAPNLLYRTILMTLYSTGMRRAELVQLKAADIDKKLMLVRIRFFGFLAGPRRSKMLSLARQLLQVEHPHDAPVSTVTQVAFQCPVCATPMILVERLSAAKLCRLTDANRDAFHDSS